MKAIIYTCIVLAVVLSCKKDNQMNSPEITILSPTNGQMINSGDSTLVDVTIVDEDLHEATFRVAKASDGTIEYFTDGEHSHSADLHYSKKFKVPAVLAHTDVVLTVHAEDHEGNEADKSVTFAFMP